MFEFKFLFLLSVGAVPAVRAPSQRAIVFPMENFDDCFLGEEHSKQPGDCKPIDDCPEILMKWQRDKMYPKTCYFIKRDQYVCCPKARTNTSTSLPTFTILPTVETSTKSFLELLLDDQRPSELGMCANFSLLLCDK